MACTIVLRSLNSISVPNLVSIGQSFLKPENPSQINFSGPGARSLHVTGTATTKAYMLGKHTCNLQVWHQPRVPCGLLGQQKNYRCKTFARALHVHYAPQPLSSYGAKYALPRCTHVSSLVSLAQSSLSPEDPWSKRFSAPGACSLHPTGMATPMDFK